MYKNTTHYKSTSIHKKQGTTINLTSRPANLAQHQKHQPLNPTAIPQYKPKPLPCSSTHTTPAFSSHLHHLATNTPKLQRCNTVPTGPSSLPQQETHSKNTSQTKHCSSHLIHNTVRPRNHTAQQPTPMTDPMHVPCIKFHLLIPCTNPFLQPTLNCTNQIQQEKLNIPLPKQTNHCHHWHAAFQLYTLIRQNCPPSNPASVTYHYITHYSLKIPRPLTKNILKLTSPLTRLTPKRQPTHSHLTPCLPSINNLPLILSRIPVQIQTLIPFIYTLTLSSQKHTPTSTPKVCNSHHALSLVPKLFPFCKPPTPSHTFLPLTESSCTHDHTRLPRTATMGKSKEATQSEKSSESRRPIYSLKSQPGSNSKKKRIAIRMESLALHIFAQPLDDSEGPIAIRDFPEGCNPLPARHNTGSSSMDTAAPHKPRRKLQLEAHCSLPLEKTSPWRTL